jgi:hypothetical protein
MSLCQVTSKLSILLLTKHAKRTTQGSHRQPARARRSNTDRDKLYLLAGMLFGILAILPIITAILPVAPLNGNPLLLHPQQEEKILVCLLQLYHPFNFLKQQQQQWLGQQQPQQQHPWLELGPLPHFPNHQ